MKAQLNLFNDKAAILAKDVLKERVKNTHFEAAHPSFTLIKWQAGDELLPIQYRVENTPHGELLIAATSKGIAYLGFVISGKASTVADLKRRFPDNTISEGDNTWLGKALERIIYPAKEIPLYLHMKGTEFQISIWEKLLLIPFGGLTNYKQLGNGKPDARAVGGAVGANPVGFLVPCHRVIRADGTFNGFLWGNEVKARLLTYEAGL